MGAARTMMGPVVVVAPAPVFVALPPAVLVREVVRRREVVRACSPRRGAAGSPMLLLDWDKTLLSGDCQFEQREDGLWARTSRGLVSLASREFWVEKCGGEQRLAEIKKMLQQLLNANVKCHIVSNNLTAVLAQGICVLDLKPFFTSSRDGSLRITARQDATQPLEKKSTMIQRLLRLKQPSCCLFIDDNQLNLDDAQNLCHRMLVEPNSQGMTARHWQSALDFLCPAKPQERGCPSNTPQPEQRPKPGAVKCNHTLENFKVSNSDTHTTRCDECGGQFPPRASAFGCFMCNYHQCEVCHAAKPKVADRCARGRNL